MRLPKDLFGAYTKPKIFLCETDKQKMGILNTTDTHVSLKFNSYSELTFNIDRTYIDTLTGNKQTNLFYDRIEHPRLILLDNIGYFQIQAPDTSFDGFKESKTITAYSSEYALSQKYITDLHINTGEVDSVEVIYAEEIGLPNTIEPVIFYNATNPRLSLLHLALEGVYGWKIGHIDDSLKTLARSFDIDRQSVYDFLMNDVCEKCNCYIVFDTLKNEINIYAESMSTKFIGDGNTKTFIVSPPFYKIETVSVDGYKTTQWEYNKKTGELTFSTAPKNGVNIEVVDGGLTTWETNVFITYENLAKELNVSYNADDIITKLTITYGDDQDIREINMGQPYIMDLSYFYGAEYSVANVDKNTIGTYYIQTPAYREVYLPDDYNQFETYYTLNISTMKYTKMSSTAAKKYVGTCYAYAGEHYKQVVLPNEYKSSTIYYAKNNGWMGDDLYNAYSSYIIKSQAYQSEYASNSQEMLKISNCKYFEEQRLSMAYSEITTVDSSTIGTYYVKDSSNGGYFFKEVVLPDDYKASTKYYKFDGVKLNSEKVNDLYLAIRENFMSASIEDKNEAIKALDESIKKINELSDAFEFMNDNDSYGIAYLVKNLNNFNSLETKKPYVMKFLNEMWEQIGRTPLKSVYQETFKTLQSTNIDWAQEHKDPDGNVTYHENYPWYYAILLFLESIDTAIVIRDQQIDKLQSAYDELQAKNIKISNSLLMENNFTEDQLIRLSAFIKEDELHIEDIVETEYDTLEDSFKVKQDAMETGRIELSKRCQPQLQFSMTMANIYAIKEFEQIIDQFQLGKIIKVGLRKNYIKQARLLQVDMNLDNLSDFQAQFGELTDLRNQSDIHADLLSQAIQAGKSVASSQGNWNSGADMAISTDIKIQQGLLDATTSLKSMDGTQGVEIDKYGIHLKRVNPDTGEIDPKQGWITNNMMVYTDNNWTSSKSVFGEYKINNETRWGLLADACIAGYMEGSTIVGGKIGIGERDDKSYNFSVNYEGHMIAQSADVVGKITADSGAIRGDLEISGALKHTNGNYTVQLQGVQEDPTQSVFHIEEKNGTTKYPFRVNGDGSMSATKGDIGGWSITDSKIYSSDRMNKVCVVQKPSSSDSIVFATGGDSHDNYSTCPFRVTSAGNLYASKGEIGGWSITDSKIYSGTSTTKTCVMQKPTSTDTIVFAAGGSNHSSYSNSPFYVTADGRLNSTSGTIGGFDITKTYISNTKKTYDDANDGVYIGTNGIGLGKAKFYVTKYGELTATNAKITGKITSTEGEIGGWTIGQNQISGTSGAYKAIMSKAGIGVSGNVVFGVAIGDDYQAYIDGVGKLYAKGANIEGTIKSSDADITGKVVANSGTIGGCQIIGGLLKINSANIDSINAETITVNKLKASQIEGLPASHITSGTFDVNRIPGLPAGKINNGTVGGYSCSWQIIDIITKVTITTRSTTIDGISVLTGLSKATYKKMYYMLTANTGSYED